MKWILIGVGGLAAIWYGFNKTSFVPYYWDRIVADRFNKSNGLALPVTGASLSGIQQVPFAAGNLISGDQVLASGIEVPIAYNASGASAFNRKAASSNYTPASQ